MRLSRLCKKCRECPKKDKCDHKKMEETGYLIPASAPVTQSIGLPASRDYTPVTIHMGEYGDVDTSLEEIHEQLTKSINKQLHPGLFFMPGA